MARWWVAVAVFAGCYSPTTERPCKVSCNAAAGPAAICPGAQECMADNLCHAPGDPTCPPSEVDADVPLADAALIDLFDNSGPPYCFGSGLLRFCSQELSSTSLSFASLIDTNADCTATEPSGTAEVCVIYGGSITITDTVRAIGPRPLALVAVETIDVQGTLDAGSRRIGGAGAGAGTGSCPGHTNPGIGGGGAGGTFRGQGGNGGAAAAGTQGVAPMPFAPTFVRGGCPGGVSLAATGTPGRGGGVIYLIAGSAITVRSGGRLDVSGAGATFSDGGGYGGGSGGLIVLDAAGLQIAGDLMANGGGGAQGSSGGTAAVGEESSGPTSPGAGGGGTGPRHGGPGSAGSASLVGGFGVGTGTGSFAGGGGGGAGWIYYRGGSLVPTSHMSPPPVPL